jgi:hypothetical protein
MEPTQDLRDRDRLTRTALAAGLAVFALRSLRRGKRLRGVLAGLGAFAVGYGASTESDDGLERLAQELDTDSTTEDEQLRCAVCGEPIVAGQSRQPNESGETVHESCA